MNEINKIIKKLHKNPLISESSQYKSELDNIKEKMHDKNFKLAIVGEFSSGKSTFINSLLGKDILKHATVETTATITNIHNIDASKKNKILVNYSNGKSIKHENFNSLKECTTTDSEEDVATNIESVDIYMHFMDTTENIIIVDTPGLNGIADNHREKTIEEIKRSHACIYLFQKNGVTDSDRDFIKLLFKYQNNFIFILNFIDELRQSEGETTTDKIKTIENEIEKIIKSTCDESIKIQYDIYGISALKALASKDENIKRLYENDVFDLTDERREKILKESNIENVENKINYLIKNNGKSKEELAYYSLCLLLEEIIIKERLIKDLNESLMEQDGVYKNKEQALKLRNEITDKENLIIEKLTNLVDAEFIRGKKLLNKDIEDTMYKLQEYMYSVISNSISIEELLKLKNQIQIDENYLTNNKGYSKINAKKLAEINAKINAETFKRLEENSRKEICEELKKNLGSYENSLERNQYYVVQNIYKSMLKRLNEYSKYSSKKIKDLDDINIKNINISTENSILESKSKEIEEIKRQIELNDLNQKSADKNKHDAIKKKNNIDKEHVNVKSSIETIVDRRILEEYELGTRPSRKIIGYDYTKREVNRTGLFGGIVNFFAGPKIVKESTPKYNDYDIKEWDRKKKSLDIKYENEIKYLTDRSKKLLEQKNEYLEKEKKNNIILENTNRRLKFLQVQIETKKRELKEYENVAQNEYLRALKQQFLESVDNYLINNKNTKKKSVTDVLKDNVKQNISVNKKKIEKEVQIQCKNYIKAEIERLDTLIHGDIRQLKEKYKVKEHLVLQLQEIYKDLREENHE